MKFTTVYIPLGLQLRHERIVTDPYVIIVGDISDHSLLEVLKLDITSSCANWLLMIMSLINASRAYYTVRPSHQVEIVIAYVLKNKHIRPRNRGW